MAAWARALEAAIRVFFQQSTKKRLGGSIAMDTQRRSVPEKVIYVYSGKGGVGKSTICVNLAYALALQGVKVGLFDADLSGPSIPVMVRAIETQPPRFDNFRVIPGLYGGVFVNSIGFICEPVEGGYWQGKYLEGVLHQMLLDTDWQGIDTLVIDMPPGVGELHRTIFSKIPGKALIVTTPQNVSYSDTIRAIEMLQRMKIDIVGVVENMSFYICDCGAKSAIFKGNTYDTLCKPYGLELLLQLPVNSEISSHSNSGIPFICSNSQHSAAIELMQMTQRIYQHYDQFRFVRPTNY